MIRNRWWPNWPTCSSKWAWSRVGGAWWWFCWRWWLIWRLLRAGEWRIIHRVGVDVRLLLLRVDGDIVLIRVLLLSRSWSRSRCCWWWGIWVWWWRRSGGWWSRCWWGWTSAWTLCRTRLRSRLRFLWHWSIHWRTWHQWQEIFKQIIFERKIFDQKIFVTHHNCPGPGPEVSSHICFSSGHSNWVLSLGMDSSWCVASSWMTWNILHI